MTCLALTIATLGLVLCHALARPMQRSETRLTQLAGHQQQKRDANSVDFVAVDFLTTYGWAAPNDTTESIIGDGENSPLMQFQRFFGLEPTGEMDDATRALMSESRCGKPDKFGQRVKRQQDLYKMMGFKHNETNTLTYDFLNYWTGRPEQEQRDAVRWAADQWSNIIKMNFTFLEKNGVIKMGFYTGRHVGDDTLLTMQQFAHANYGFVHYNSEVDWNRQDRLQGIALHELGHVLGLEHSGIKGDVMYPNYVKTLQLSQRDLQQIWMLYEKRESCSGFQCADGSACLSPRQKCNGQRECTDGSDETSCPASILCTDMYPSCAGWKDVGACSSSETFMNLACQKTCGKCSLGVIAPCDDHSTLCKRWLADNQCIKNPHYMSVVCRKSCNACDGSMSSNADDVFFSILPETPS